MYVADPATLAAHRLFENGLDEGIPVLVKAAAQVFDNSVFTPAAMQALAIEDHHLSGSKVRFSWLTSSDCRAGVLMPGILCKGTCCAACVQGFAWGTVSDMSQNECA